MPYQHACPPRMPHLLAQERRMPVCRLRRCQSIHSISLPYANAGPAAPAMRGVVGGWKKKEPCAALPVCACALQTRLQVLGPGTMQRVLSWASSFPFTITSRCTRAQCPDRTILRLRARESFVAWSESPVSESESEFPLCALLRTPQRLGSGPEMCPDTSDPPLSYGSVR